MKSEKPLFVIDDDPVVDWPVIVRLPVDGGTFDEYQFTAKLRVLSPTEYAALAPDTNDASATLTMREVLRDNAQQFAGLVVGWSGIKDLHGNDVPFTPGKLAEQITGKRGVELSAGLWMAIREIRSGARLKNSVPPSVAG